MIALRFLAGAAVIAILGFMLLSEIRKGVNGWGAAMIALLSVMGIIAAIVAFILIEIFLVGFAVTGTVPWK